MMVEVEAYGGVPDGPWPDAASHSYRGPSARNVVMFGPAGAAVHVSQPRHPRLRECGLRSGRNAAGRPDAGRGDHRRNRDGATAPGPGGPDAALARGPGNLCSALGITMADNGIDLFDPASPVRLELGGARPSVQRTARRSQQGRRPAVAVLARRPARGLGLSTQSARARTRRQRLITGHAERSTAWARRSSTSWSGAD